MLISSSTSDSSSIITGVYDLYKSLLLLLLLLLVVVVLTSSSSNVYIIFLVGWPSGTCKSRH